MGDKTRSNVGDVPDNLLLCNRVSLYTKLVSLYVGNELLDGGSHSEGFFLVLLSKKIDF